MNAVGFVEFYGLYDVMCSFKMRKYAFKLRNSEEKPGNRGNFEDLDS